MFLVLAIGGLPWLVVSPATHVAFASDELLGRTSDRGADEEAWIVSDRIGLSGTPPFRIAAGRAHIWVLRRGERGCDAADPCSLVRIDPRSERVIGAAIPLADPWDLTIGAGSVWVTQFDGPVVRVDEAMGRVEASIDPPAGRFGGAAISFGAEAVWLTAQDSPDGRASLVKLDPSTNRVVDSLASDVVDARTQSIAFGDDAVWLVDHDHFMVQIDPVTVEVRTREGAGFVAIGIAVGDQHVFLADPLGRRLVSVDATSGKVDRSAALPVAPIYPAFAHGSIWTLGQEAWGDSIDDDRVFRIDPGTLAIVETFHVGGNPADIAFGHGSGWVAVRTGMIARLDLAG
jgi:hypothetical protein